MRRNRSPFSVLLNEGIREDYFRGDRPAQKVSRLLGISNHHRRVTVNVHLHVGKFD